MTLCCKCGAHLEPDENFCGVCGARQVRNDGGLAPAGIVADHVQPHPAPPGRGSQLSQSFDGERTLEPSSKNNPMTSARGTGGLNDSEDYSSKTSRADEVPDRRPKPKTLVAGKVLNNRYEIVRRIGGGGMGAVYLAKDRNLGEVPRAAKEMIE